MQASKFVICLFAIILFSSFYQPSEAKLRYRWRLIARNGRQMMISYYEQFVSRATVLGGVASAVENLPNEDRVEFFRNDMTGEFYWTLKAGNGQIIGVSGRSYPDLDAAKDGYSNAVVYVDSPIQTPEDQITNPKWEIYAIDEKCERFDGYNSTAGPYEEYDYCWYLGAPGKTCDQVCKGLSGGINLALDATNIYPDTSCTSFPKEKDLSVFFFENGNPGIWNKPIKAPAYWGYGYGYQEGTSSQYPGAYYGKCTSSSKRTDNGVKPGTKNDDKYRSLICPCYSL
eukprot:TRINITY_DN9647_c0_g1_i1.p1 TRINITY_DN9647_c0_g1~~TRINITY_DN9647_c0_g1_i1.p1  ORF type:complete len:295 (+),score=58.28 TRINITY_DN9647_c0_g1_i1:32-886(+)